MDQELKQRLIGAAVITALAAIFVPMLFDDPIDESGKSINELKIPELPMPSGTQGKTQDVEIMPLPEKVEDVAAVEPEPKPPAPVVANPVIEEGGDDEAALETQRTPRIQLTEKETSTAKPAKWVEADEDVASAEMESAVVKPVTNVDKPKPVKTPTKVEPVKTPKPVATTPVVAPASVQSTPSAAIVAAEPVVKAPVTENATVRWYLNAGSFGQKANAATLQDNLKKQGFAASIKEVVGPKGTVYKVRVGPMLDKVKAQAMKAKLAQINVNSFLSGDE